MQGSFLQINLRVDMSTNSWSQYRLDLEDPMFKTSENAKRATCQRAATTSLTCPPTATMTALRQHVHRWSPVQSRGAGAACQRAARDRSRDPTLGIHVGLPSPNTPCRAYPNATRLGLGRTAESWGWCLARQSYASPMKRLAYRPTYGMR